MCTWRMKQEERGRVDEAKSTPLSPLISRNARAHRWRFKCRVKARQCLNRKNGWATGIIQIISNRWLPTMMVHCTHNEHKEKNKHLTRDPVQRPSWPWALTAPLLRAHSARCQMPSCRHAIRVWAQLLRMRERGRGRSSKAARGQRRECAGERGRR